MNNEAVSMPMVANTGSGSSATSNGVTTSMTKAKAQTIATFPLQSNEAVSVSSRSQASHNDGQIKGFQMRAKKDSSSSSTISTDSAIISSATDKSTTILSTKPKPKSKSSAESEKTQVVGGGRDSSHYSTNKSGSSGYYSSNVCSTYSLEDHIYSEPLAVDGGLDKVNKNNSKSVQLARQNRNRTAALNRKTLAVDGIGSDSLKILKNSRSRDMHGAATGKASAIEADDEETDEADRLGKKTKNKQQQIQGKSNEKTFNDNLRILEHSIENLDRHLRNFPSLPTQERIAAYVQVPNHATHFLPHHLPTIMEGYVPNSQPRSWADDIADDSLMDIDLDSFLLSSDKHKLASKSGTGIDNPSFLTDEQEENTYKCVKYINSCPEDAYRVESDIVTVSDNSDQFRQRYEDQLHFENTRELLEDVRDKIRSLTLSSATLASSQQLTEMPQELEAMIKALKGELETYLARINQHSDREIRQLCTGIVKNQNVVRLTKAFERRRSEFDIGGTGVPLSIRQQITSIRCASDPNFKMKRKSLAEVFPAAETFLKSINEKSQQQQQQQQVVEQTPEQTQLQRNLSFHQPVLKHMHSKANISNNLNVSTNDIQAVNMTGVGNGVGSGENAEQPGDKESILEWHRKKPSNWEMYYGTNRLSQSLLAAQRTNRQPTNTQATMSYVSLYNIFIEQVLIYDSF